MWRYIRWLKRSADINLTKGTHQNIHWLNRKIVYTIQPTKLTSSYYLRHKLREKGLHTLRVTNGADVLIVKTAIETTTHNHSVADVSEDVDPSVLLIVSTLFQLEISWCWNLSGHRKTKTMALSTQDPKRCSTSRWMVNTSSSSIQFLYATQRWLLSSGEQGFIIKQ